MNHKSRSKEDIINMMRQPVPESAETLAQAKDQPNEEEQNPPLSSKQTKGQSSSDSFSKTESGIARKNEIERIIITVLPAIEEVGEHVANTESRVSSIRGQNEVDLADNSPRDSKNGEESPTLVLTLDRSVPVSKTPIQKLAGHVSNEDSKASSQQNFSLAERKTSQSSSDYRDKIEKANEVAAKGKRHSQFKKSKFNPEGKLE